MRRTKEGFTKPIPKHGKVVSEPAFGVFVVHLPVRNIFVIMERFNLPNGNNSFNRLVIFGAQYYADQGSAETEASQYVERRAA